VIETVIVLLAFRGFSITNICCDGGWGWLIR